MTLRNRFLVATALLSLVWMPAWLRGEDQAPRNSIMPLYRALRTVGLDPQKVFTVRDAVIDRSDLHIFLNDGAVVFTQEVEGHVTGMYFEGDGEVLVRPPNRTEKLSLGLFTKLGVLDDKFTHAYFRFNDDVYTDLKPYLRAPVEMDLNHVKEYDDAAQRLADVDALRLLVSFTSGLAKNEKGRPLLADHFLHGRIGGSNLGTYDVFYDTRSAEQITIGEQARADGYQYYDTWMSFEEAKVRNQKQGDAVAPLRPADSIHVTRFKIDTTVHPPNEISAEADLDVEVRQGGARVLFFELSHELKLRKVTMDGAAIEWLQNEALEGSQLARRGNDFITLVLPSPCKAGDRMKLHFTYDGTVLADAGGGLLYVGAHGTWYPNRGLTPSMYELSFTYPEQWTLVAVGKKTAETQNGELRTSKWVSDRPVPVAGFNLGHYVETREMVRDVEIAAYAAHGVEKDFPSTQTYSVQRRRDPWFGPSVEEVTVPLNINPAATTKAVAQDAAKAVTFYDRLLGPYPFSSLRLTQFPGPDSQGWPGLIYLSSYSFLTPEIREKLGMSDFMKALFGSIMVRHEVAHMWWGHEVFWDTYRDQWLSEALANYSALMMTQQDEPEKFRMMMEAYRTHLLSKRDGRDLYEAGPVTLGVRLNSSKFPDAYQAIAYGRGTWLIHMLRCMLEDGARATKGKNKITGDELFLQVLRKILEEHRDTGINNEDVRKAFESVWPESLRFEGRKSLDWFFDGWVNGTALPALDVTGVKFSKQGEETYVSGTIRQKDAPDDLVTSVPVYSRTGDRFDYIGRVFAVGDETHFRLRMHGAGRKIVLDPYHTVLTR